VGRPVFLASETMLNFSLAHSNRWLNRPDLLKVTIAESRPNCDGVVLAKRLHDVVEMSADRAKHLREMGRSHSDPRGAGAGGGASPGGGIKLPQTLRERLKQGLGRTGEDGAPMGTYGTLEGLMNAVNSNTNPLGASKVCYILFFCLLRLDTEARETGHDRSCSRRRRRLPAQGRSRRHCRRPPWRREDPSRRL
jgi:hypothetical protein